MLSLCAALVRTGSEPGAGMMCVVVVVGKLCWEHSGGGKDSVQNGSYRMEYFQYCGTVSCVVGVSGGYAGRQGKPVVFCCCLARRAVLQTVHIEVSDYDACSGRLYERLFAFLRKVMATICGRFVRRERNRRYADDAHGLPYRGGRASCPLWRTVGRRVKRLA